MKQLLIPKEYKELLDEKAHVEKELRWFLIKKIWSMRHYDALMAVAELKLKGGPKNISSKLDYYLYA